MNFGIHKYSLLTLLCIIVLSSCQKEEHFSSEVPGLEKKEGDNDEPFVLGAVYDESLQPVYPATVVLVAQGGTTPIDSVETAVDGSYGIATGKEGFFFLRIYQNHVLTFTTDAVEVTDTVNLPVIVP
ncbi:MAG: hypothetical protein ACPF9D_13595 [Owenweeksia sp.]